MQGIRAYKCLYIKCSPYVFENTNTHRMHIGKILRHLRWTQGDGNTTEHRTNGFKNQLKAIDCTFLSLTRCSLHWFNKLFQLYLFTAWKSVFATRENTNKKILKLWRKKLNEMVCIMKCYISCARLFGIPVCKTKWRMYQQTSIENIDDIVPQVFRAVQMSPPTKRYSGSKKICNQTPCC